MPEFFSNAFNAALTTESILFAAFGFLFAAYVQYTAVPPPPQSKAIPAPQRAPIANTLAMVCKGIVGLIALNALLAIYSLIRINLSSIEQMLLGLGFGVTMIAIVVISWILARRM